MAEMTNPQAALHNAVLRANSMGNQKPEDVVDMAKKFLYFLDAGCAGSCNKSDAKADLGDKIPKVRNSAKQG